MGTEIEMKLGMDPATLERLRRHPVIRAHRVGRAVSKTLTSVYFDTPDHALRTLGAHLRVRHDGKARIQGVKTRSGTQGAHLARGEWERPITGDHPDAESLAGLAEFAPAVAEALSALSPEDAVRPLFATRFRRSAIVLQGEGWEIELTLDVGDVETATASVPLCEAELELRKGRPADLYALARRLAEDLPIRPLIGSKSDAGYLLSAGRPPTVVKAGPLPLSDDMTAAEAFRAIGRDCLHHLLVNEPLLRRHRLPDAVHQMRVALRRLRSALSLFGPLVATPQADALKEDLRWLTAALGAARDVDVFLAGALPPVEALHPGDPGLAAVRATLEARRDGAYDAALEAAGGPRFTRLVLDLGAWLEDGDWCRPAENDSLAAAHLARPVRDLAAEVLGNRHGKVSRKGRHFARLDVPQRHALRIHVKKLRYAAEFFAALFGKRKSKRYIAAMAAAQDHLGLLNDVAVGQEMMHALAAQSRGKGAQTMAFAAGLIAGWHDGRRAADEPRACKDWKAFQKVEPFWT